MVHVPALEACRCLRGTHLQAGQVGAGPGFAMRARGAVPRADARWARFHVRTLDGRGDAVLPWGAQDGRGHGFRTLALVGNGMERVGCDVGTGARELCPDTGLDRTYGR